MTTLPVPNASDESLIEGIARVIRIENGSVRLEPEQGTTCGTCASAGVCGAKGIGTIASRLEYRRFALPNDLPLEAGDRVVLGIRRHSFITASALAYVLPLLLSLGGAACAQWQAGNDAITLGCAIAGLAAGFGIVRLVARRFISNQETEFRILRKAGPDEHCNR